jgi:hypothetical protein
LILIKKKKFRTTEHLSPLPFGPSNPYRLPDARRREAFVNRALLGAEIEKLGITMSVALRVSFSSAPTPPIFMLTEAKKKMKIKGRWEWKHVTQLIIN